MALQIVLKIEGIYGESKSYQYKGWSEVISWNWGMTSNRKSTQGIEGDKTSLNELSVMKPIGVDSGSIRLLFAQGKKIPSVQLVASPVVGKREAPMKYVNIVMEDVVIKAIVTSGTADDNFFKEHITFLYDRVRFECSRAAQESGDSTEENVDTNDFGWNVTDNQQW